MRWWSQLFKCIFLLSVCVLYVCWEWMGEGGTVFSQNPWWSRNRPHLKIWPCSPNRHPFIHSINSKFTAPYGHLLTAGFGVGIEPLLSDLCNDLLDLWVRTLALMIHLLFLYYYITHSYTCTIIEYMTLLWFSSKYGQGALQTIFRVWRQSRALLKIVATWASVLQTAGDLSIKRRFAVLQNRTIAAIILPHKREPHSQLR